MVVQVLTAAGRGVAKGAQVAMQSAGRATTRTASSVADASSKAASSASGTVARGGLRVGVANNLKQSYSNKLKHSRNKDRKAQLVNKQGGESSMLRDAVNVAKVFSLFFSKVEWYDVFIAFALFLAALKDILDIAVIGSLPGIGHVITYSISLGIMFLFMLVGSFDSGRLRLRLNRKLWKKIRKYVVLVIATTVESVFGINFLPIEFISVIVMYYLVLKDR